MRKISFVIIYRLSPFVKNYLRIFREIFGNATLEVIILALFRYFLLFLLGGSGYYALECLWRGWSHISMFFAGGICFLLLGKLNALRPPLKLPLRGIVGALIITMVELAAGLLVNRHYRVWDYRHLPLNFCGQICLPFTLLWAFLSLGAMKLYAWADQAISSALGLPKGRK